MKFKARTNGARGRFYESCEEHAAVVAALAGAFAAPFGMARKTAAAGFVHDAGKYSANFQEMITHPDKPMHVDHSTAGAQIALRHQLLASAFAIAGHHAGIPDLGAPGKDHTLFGRKNKDVGDYGAWAGFVHGLHWPRPLPCKDRLLFMTETRMLQSCIVDADRLDAEYFTSLDRRPESGDVKAARHLLDEQVLAREIPVQWTDVLRTSAHVAKRIERRQARRMKSLLEIMLKGDRHLLDIDRQGGVDTMRGELLRAVIRAGKKPALSNAVYTLTAPTGSGKTNAGLTFALEQAVRTGRRRVIYVIPYMSIIDQTAVWFDRILRSRNILAHYSEAPWQVAGDSNRPFVIRSQNAAENWDMPIVLTTAAQFFDSFYSNRPSALRKLHNIADSVVLFDEAQTFPVDSLWPMVSMISILAQHYNVLPILCTATQPRLKPLFAKAGIAKTKEINPKAGQHVRPRVTIHAAQKPYTAESLAKTLLNYRQVLCVVNTRHLAIDVANMMDPAKGVWCLTTLQTPHDRRRIIGHIKARLAQGRPCRVVSTSLIEAGVDLDFPRAFRQKAGLDSVLQTAGRCNREGTRPAKDSIVTVFAMAKGGVNPLISSNIAAFDAAREAHPDILSEEAMDAYFDNLLVLGQGSSGTDPGRAFDVQGYAHGDNVRLLRFATIGKNRLIRSYMEEVYIPEDESAKKLCQKILAGTATRHDYRRAGQYVAALSPSDIKKMGSKVRQVDGSDEYVLVDFAAYTPARGIQV